MDEDKISVGNWGSREEVITYLKKNGITVKCSPVSRTFKRGGGAGPALRIIFKPAGSTSTASFFSGKTKAGYIEILGLRTKEDCERVNRELES